MKKLNTIIWTLFVLTGARLSYFIIMNDKERVLYAAIYYFVVCMILQVVSIKEDREQSLKYIKK